MKQPSFYPYLSYYCLPWHAAIRSAENNSSPGVMAGYWRAFDKYPRGESFSTTVLIIGMEENIGGFYLSPLIG